eukprot:5475898-Prymnesium_polylepis.1
MEGRCELRAHLFLVQPVRRPDLDWDLWRAPVETSVLVIAGHDGIQGLPSPPEHVSPMVAKLRPDPGWVRLLFDQLQVHL